MMSDDVKRNQIKYVGVNWRVWGEVVTQIGRRLDGWMDDSLVECFV